MLHTLGARRNTCLDAGEGEAVDGDALAAVCLLGDGGQQPQCVEHNSCPVLTARFKMTASNPQSKAPCLRRVLLRVD